MNTAAFVTLTKDELWYAHDRVAGQLLHEEKEWAEAAKGLTLEVESALQLCLLTASVDAVMVLRKPEVLLAIASINPEDKDARGVSVGREVMLKFIMARLFLDSDDGLEITNEGLDLTYNEAKELTYNEAKERNYNANGGSDPDSDPDAYALT